MAIIILRIYLAAGIIFHKAVWELLKHKGSQAAEHRPRLLSRTFGVKVAKVAILLGIVGQIVAPEIFPILENSGNLRVIGASVYTCGLLVAIASRLQLGRNWSDIETAQVLARQHVVSIGVYRYVRHPIYVGDLMLLLGLELALNSWLVAGVVLMTPIVLRQAIREELMLRNKLDGYASYCQSTKRFIPFIV